MSQKLPVNNLEWTEEISQFNENFIKTIMKKVMKDIIVRLIFNTPKIYMSYIFLSERLKL